MFTHPELMFLQATERRLELETRARHARLAASQRRPRRRGRQPDPVRVAAPEPVPAAGHGRAPAESPPAGNLAACVASGASAR